MEKTIMTITFVLVVTMFWSIIDQGIKEQRTWQQFSVDHNCQVIEKRKGQVHTGIGGGVAANGQYVSGNMTTFDSDQTAYKCDDGVTYWR